MTEKIDQKRPLDMTTEEAIDYLFPKEVVTELKRVANREPAKLAETKENVGKSLSHDE